MRGPARELKGNRQSEGDTGEFVRTFMDGRPQAVKLLRESRFDFGHGFAPRVSGSLVESRLTRRA